MGKAAVAKAYADIRAALAVLHAEADGSGSEPFSPADPLAGLADGCLDILAGAREAEAGFAALKAKAAVTYSDSAQRVAGPDASVQAQEMAVAAEVGCVLALGPRAAGSFLTASHALATTLPRTLSALHAGDLTWQHALAMVDETASLDAAGAAALEAHFLDQDVPDPARGCPAGEMPAHRFKAKARTWRERHHAESIEKATPSPSRTVGWSSGRTRTGWPGSPRTCPPTKPWPAGTGSPPSPGACRAPTSPAP